MNTFLFATLVCGFVLLSLWVGRTAKSSLTSTQDYYLSQRTVKPVALCLSFLATQLGGGSILGTGEAAYQMGWFAILYSLGLSLGFIALGLGVGRRFRTLEISTLPEIFEKTQGSIGLRRIASFVSICSLFLILVAVCVAARKLFTSCGLESQWFFVGTWLAITAYTTFGGLGAVVKTDVLQVSAIAVILLVVLGVVIASDGFWPSATTSTFSSSLPWSDWVIMPLMFVLIGQDMGQRCAAAESPAQIRWSALAAAILLFGLTAIPTYLGLRARTLGLPAEDSSILLGVISQIAGPHINAFFATAIFLAIVSTADSLICAVSLNIGLDFARDKKVPTGLNSARLITFAVSTLALGLSFGETGIIELMLVAYRISVFSLFVPLVTACYLQPPPKAFTYLSFLTGAIAGVFATTGTSQLLWFLAILSLNLIGQAVRYQRNPMADPKEQ